MKKSFLILAIIVLTGTLKAQYNPWSEAIPLTDSTTINTNPDVLVQPDATYMFYEKKVDENSPSMIYYRDIYNMTDEQVLFGSTEFSYRNPNLNRVVDFTADDTYLLYESNEAGNYDIYAIKIFEDGTFGSPVQLTNTPADESYISIPFYFDVVSWESGGSVFISKLITDPDTVYLEDITLIDTGNCKNPVCGGSVIGYLKTEDDSAHFYYAKRDSLPFYWSAPKIIDSTGNCSSLSILTEPLGIAGNPPSFLWEKSGKIYFYSDETEIVNIPGDSTFLKVFQPSGLPYTMPVKTIPGIYVSFVANSDVYAFYFMQDYNWETPFNLSDNGVNNSNPKLLLGWETDNPCDIYFLDIWETHLESGGVSLWMSKTAVYVCGDIDENKSNSALLKISPNPFSDEVNIRFYQVSGSSVQIDIYSLNGKLVKSYKIGTPGYGWNTIKWSPENTAAKGVYNVAIKQDGIVTTSKIVRY